MDAAFVLNCAPEDPLNDGFQQHDPSSSGMANVELNGGA